MPSSHPNSSAAAAAAADDNNNPSSSLSLLNLPSELHQPIASFLDLKSAFALSSTCRTLKRSLNLSWLPPEKLLSLMKWRSTSSTGHTVRLSSYIASWLSNNMLSSFINRRDEFQKVTYRHTQSSYIKIIPNDFTRRKRQPSQDQTQSYCIHSITLQFQFHDQGWGKRKGRLHIVDMFSNRIIIDSKLAPHDEETSYMTFYLNHRDDSKQEQQEQYYEVWYTVGNDPGYSLTVKNLTMNVLVFG